MPVAAVERKERKKNRAIWSAVWDAPVASKSLSLSLQLESKRLTRAIGERDEKKREINEALFNFPSTVTSCKPAIGRAMLVALKTALPPRTLTMRIHYLKGEFCFFFIFMVYFSYDKHSIFKLDSKWIGNFRHSMWLDISRRKLWEFYFVLLKINTTFTTLSRNMYYFFVTLRHLDIYQFGSENKRVL